MTTSHEALSGKRILVTGGAGFIGSHIVDLLQESDCGEIVVIDNMVRGRPDNLSAAMARGQVLLVDGDIRDTSLVQDLVAGSDIVFHQAALRITHCAEAPVEAMEVMVDATFRLLDACRTSGVEKVVMASSASIYGMATRFPTEETEPPYGNRTFYGAAKSFGEGLLRSMNDQYGLNYVALRYFNAYGPRMDIHGRYTEVMVRWMERLAAGLPPLIFGDGLQTMDLIHVRDIARANILAATCGRTDSVYNVGSQTETSLAELAAIFARSFGRPDLVPEHLPERSVNPVPRRLASAAKARDELGFVSTVGRNEGIADLIAWWKAETVTAVTEAAQ